MESQMCYDDVAWEQSDDISDNWLSQFLDINIKRPIAQFILKHDSGDDPEFKILQKGSFNITLQMKYTYGATNIRFPQPGAVLFPEEKVQNEVAVMRYISDQTSVPIPFVLHSGTQKESPPQPRPVYHDEPYCPFNDHLDKLYRQLAMVLLDLSKPQFQRIGSLSQVDDFTWKVTGRPLSMNMNELVRLGTLPRSKLPPQFSTFQTASSYIEYLAQLNILHLIYQRNDAVKSADDCRRKYVARLLFHKLAKDKKLSQSCHENGPFKLWCDDFRPANILLHDDLTIAGIVDWEFTYAAPLEFSYAPPWWLLIEKPEFWREGLDGWTRVFERRLETFLAAMRHCEEMASQQGQCRLSEKMRQSWETGDFWVVYGLLHSFAFDAIYWQKIDRRFFGPTKTNDPNEAWKERLYLLDQDQRRDMERLVTSKLAEMEERVLAWDPDEYTENFRQQLKMARAEKLGVD
ncbi:hypothetical protein N7468_004544 [Penicillium chermesinum]|uniref:Aminoglycoside phosphotransferase domain-containing protein n=1 Tax=Penicillium chermesinum TaxID=63820 RepID=A0A9W9P8Z1_9EURO|nr:uncharacterized protein N7468_004544 [Penicillium chermesinum]KAJ5239925.1 hypothetical protein N7468_004544 [Penicillium chermesinum]KAJ6166800.1 hypothetical protein N7470_002247 [Penicillium chermesinum]